MRGLGIVGVGMLWATGAGATEAQVSNEGCFDLEAGVVVDDRRGCGEDGDIQWPYNGTPPGWNTLFWNEQFVDVAYVALPYEQVTTLNIADAAFCDFLGGPGPQCEAGIHDRPWEPGRTAIVRTGAGNLYRVRWLSFDIDSSTVVFEYSPIPDGEPAPQAGRLRFTQQGRLLDAAGGPLEGSRSLIIGLHDSADGDSALWTRTFPDTAFSNGFFSVTLSGDDDDGTSLDHVSTSDLWMSFTVDGSELGSRQRMSMVPAAARAHGAAIVDASETCSVTGGLGYDAEQESLLVCIGDAWQRVALGDDTREAGCPEGFAARGSLCIDPSLNAADHWDDALTDCMSSGARLCSAAEMTYACKERGAIGLSIPDQEWVWLEGRTLKTWNNNGYTPTNHVFRRQGSSCFDRQQAYNSPMHSVSWYWGTDQFRYYCCADAR